MPGDFCPKCGKKIKRGVKFCPYCGANIGPIANQNPTPVQPQVTQPVVNQPVVNQNRPTVNQQTPQMDTQQQNKTKKLIALVVVAFLALLAGGGFYFYKVSNPQNNLASQKSNMKPMDKLSSQDWAALVVTYAHNKYPKNSQWAKVYRDVKAGNASVEKSDEFTTEDGTVTAGDDEILYIVNDKTAFMLPTKTEDGSEKVTIADSDETLGTPTAKEVYEAVQSQPNAANNIKELADSVTLYSNTGSSDGDNDDSDEDSERDGFTDLQCAVMAYVYKDSSDPEGQIESLIDACTDYDAKDAWDTIPTGIGRYPNGGDHAYAISEGVDSKKFWVFKFDPDSDDVDITCHHNGKTTFHMTGNRAALIKRYGDYESDLNTLIKKINYNANHIDELRDKIDE